MQGLRKTATLCYGGFAMDQTLSLGEYIRQIVEFHFLSTFRAWMRLIELRLLEWEFDKEEMICVAIRAMVRCEN